MEVCEALCEVTAPPFADREVADAQESGDGGMGFTCGAGGDNLRPPHDAMGQ